MSLDFLPEDCFAHILSFTSPSDACRLSLVSSMARSAADSDNVWEKFLPSDYQEILSRLVWKVVYSSKKDLFFRLCYPHLIDGGRKSFSIEKSTSKKLYMLSARELSITWAGNPLYWSWKPLLQSRFAEVVELRTITWLEIHGKINTRMISAKTVYGAYLIVKFADRAYGLDSLPSEVSLEVGDVKVQGTVYLRCQENKKQDLDRMYFLNRVQALRSRVSQGREGKRVVSEREDGWFEIELGSFYNVGGDYNNNNNNKEVKMCLKEVKGEHLKGGLIVEGIEIRPKH
ncbi:hypothetical protein LWI29_000603 [Acer saccharum]|uniref:F-box domain-containing protein n=1 Tax=Acer saccharum TaxID=4024 RepID=A0AA39SIU9_ACESA|nr:hypothetical protein LWI29_000603 [Acer saccharum]